MQEHRLATLFETCLPVDVILLRCVAVGLVALCCYAAWPGAAQELSPRAIRAIGDTAPVVESNFEILELPHIHAQTLGSWLLLAVVVAAFAAEASERGKSRASWIILALFMSCPLAASWWEPQLAVASAVRWYAIGLLIVASAALIGWELWRRDPNRVGEAKNWQCGSRALLVGLGCLSSLVGAGYALALALAHKTTTGPELLSIFGRIGPAISYAVAVGIFALYLAALAVWERSELLALAGGLVANIAATVAFVLRLAQLHLPLHTVAWIGLAQLNAIVAAVYVLAWAAWRLRFARRESESAEPGPIVVLTAFAGLCNLAVLVPVWLEIVDDPKPTAELLAAGGVRGWLAAGLTAIAICAAGRLNWRRVGSGLPTVVLFCMATILAASALCFDKFNWLGYHTLLVAHTMIGWLVAGLCWANVRGAVGRQSGAVNRTVVWSVLASMAANYLAIRASVRRSTIAMVDDRRAGEPGGACGVVGLVVVPGRIAQPGDAAGESDGEHLVVPRDFFAGSRMVGRFSVRKCRGACAAGDRLAGDRIAAIPAASSCAGRTIALLPRDESGASLRGCFVARRAAVGDRNQIDRHGKHDCLDRSGHYRRMDRTSRRRRTLGGDALGQ